MLLHRDEYIEEQAVTSFGPASRRTHHHQGRYIASDIYHSKSERKSTLYFYTSDYYMCLCMYLHAYICIMYVCMYLHTA